MKPVFTYFNHTTFDVTEAKIHVADNADGSKSIIAYYPKTWTKGDKVNLTTHDGTLACVSPYVVTEWHEVTLYTIPAPGS